MKQATIIAALVFFAGNVHAKHTGYNEAGSAEANASCNAAFNSGCPAAQTDQTYTASSTGFSAPGGEFGGSAQELALIVLLSGGALYRKRYRPKIKPDAFQNES